MWKRLIALVLSFAVPVSASAGPLKESIDRVARDLAVAQEAQVERGRSRFWTGVALLAGGGTLVILGATEAFDDDHGLDDDDDGEAGDTNGADGDGDSDWGHTAMTYGGIAAVAMGGYVLWKGWGSESSSSRITIKPGKIVVRYDKKF